MADELTIIETWLFQTLSGDAELTDLLGRYVDDTGADVGPAIFSGHAELGGEFPLVVFRWVSQIGAGDVYYNGARRAYTRQRYKTIVSNQGKDLLALASIISRIDVLLSIDNVVAVSGGNILGCFRETPGRDYPFDINQDFREPSASWDIMAQAV